MKVYDVLIQCGLCNGEVEHSIMFGKLELGQETILGSCWRCRNEDDECGVITVVEENRIYRDYEELVEWYESRKPASSYVIREDQLRDDLEVVDITAWAVPKSQYPARDWLTLRDVAELIEKGEEGVRTDWKRGRFFNAQTRGLVQRSGVTVLIHRDAVNMVYGGKENE